MEFDLGSFIIDNIEAAGVIGGYVSISIIGFTLITYLTRKKKKAESLIGPKWLHPIIGALMGAIPGCGATIVIASLYKNKKISFGGLFATFISTLGEGSFVLLGASAEADVAGNLQAYATITIFGLAAGIFFGYLSDLLRFKVKVGNIQNQVVKYERNELNRYSKAFKLFENVGCYTIIALAIFLAPGAIMTLWGESIEELADATFWASILLTIICILYYSVNRLLFKHHDCSCDNDLKSTLLHSILDIAMVVTFVFVGLVIANYIIDILVGPETFDAWMTSSAYLVVLLAALIGVMPGCGGMIAIAIAYITIPSFPMAALIAGAIATSGDGIFPLLAENRKDGLIVSGAGFLVALLVGYIALAFGI